MSLRSGVVFLVSLSVLAALAGCGGSSNGSNTTITGTTSTNSELSGTYTFSITGADSSQNFFAMAGTMVANGNGGITGGAADYNDPGSAFDGTNLAITGGSYAVGADGRGTGTLDVKTLGNVSVDFVLSSTSHGLITRFDKNGTGSGTLDLQSSVTQSQLAGSYAFSFSGLDGSGSPAALAGAFTLDGNGNVTTGVQDVTDALSVAADQPLTGTVLVGSGSAPGTATLTSPLGTTAALTFDVYVVDQTHLKLVEADSQAYLAGDVFTQQNASIPTGAAVFAIGGVDGSENPLALGGFLTFNSDGTVSGGSEDVNDNGSALSQLTFSGNVTALSGGRALLNLSGFTPAIQFAIYPSSGGLLMQETDGSALTTGTALAQTATSFSTSGGYGFNLSAANLNAGVEVDDIAAFTATSSAITGTIDENDEGSTHAGLTLTGTYTAPAGGRGTMTYTDSLGTYDFDYYVASGSSVLLIETDNLQVGVGSFLGQNGVGNSAASLVHAAMVRPKAGFHPALKKKTTDK